MLTDSRNEYKISINKEWLKKRITAAFEKLHEKANGDCFYTNPLRPNYITLDGHVDLEELVDLIVDDNDA